MKEEDLGHGAHIVTGFESLDEVFEYMAKKEADAEEYTLPVQKTIDWGTYVFRAVVDEPDGVLAIWGHIWSLEEFLERESKAGAEPDELEFTKEQMIDSHVRGYRYGEWWSVVCNDRPDIGSAHVSSLWPIPRRDFEYARRNGWRMGKQIWSRLQAEMKAAQAAHTMEKGTE